MARCMDCQFWQSFPKGNRWHGSKPNKTRGHCSNKELHNKVWTKYWQKGIRYGEPERSCDYFEP